MVFGHIFQEFFSLLANVLLQFSLRADFILFAMKPTVVDQVEHLFGPF